MDRKGRGLSAAGQDCGTIDLGDQDGRTALRRRSPKGPPSGRKYDESRAEGTGAMVVETAPIQIDFAQGLTGVAVLVYTGTPTTRRPPWNHGNTRRCDP
jgi:hypothetical protein